MTAEETFEIQLTHFLKRLGELTPQAFANVMHGRKEDAAISHAYSSIKMYPVEMLTGPYKHVLPGLIKYWKVAERKYPELEDKAVSMPNVTRFTMPVIFEKNVTFEHDVFVLQDITVQGTVTLVQKRTEDRTVYNDKVLKSKWDLVRAFFS